MKKWKTPHVMSGMTRSLNRDMSHMRKPPTSSFDRHVRQGGPDDEQSRRRGERAERLKRFPYDGHVVNTEGGPRR